ncbi:MAG: GlsB/YeaQ/YmgE family stress response membrane protein [Candidatus Thiodiazotropha endolucinida]
MSGWHLENENIDLTILHRLWVYSGAGIALSCRQYSRAETDMSVLAFLMVGMAAGWLAGMVMKGHGHGLSGNLFLGILGALIGGYLFEFFAVDSKGLLPSLITATAGAILVLTITGLVNKR